MNSNSLVDTIKQVSGLTNNQIQMWLGQRIFPNSPHYNMTCLFFLDTVLEEIVFLKAWQTVTDHSDVLRSKIDEEADGIPHLNFHPKGSCSTQIIDFSNRENAERDLKHWSLARCARAMSLNGELVDSVLVKLPGKRCAWYLSQHHIITDATSTAILYESVIREYAKAMGVAKDLPIEPPAPFYDTATKLAAFSKDAVSAASEFWRLKNKDLCPRLGFLGRKDQTDTTDSNRLVLHLSDDQSQVLKSVASEPQYRSLFPDISLFAVFSTLMSAWLHCTTGQKNIRFDTPTQNRLIPESKRALGAFIEIFPFSASIDNDTTFRALGEQCLIEVQSVLKNALPGSNFGEESTPSSAVLNFFPAAIDSIEGINVSSELIHSGHSDNVHAFRLQIHDFDRSGHYTIFFDFNTTAFSEIEQKRGLHIFQSILDAFLEDRDKRVGSVSLLGSNDHQKFLVDFNETERISDSDKTVIQLFEEQVMKTPEQAALRQARETLTYSELHTKVQSLARMLIEEGAGPDQPVAIVMKRSIDSVVAILAVMTARSAFVPIDPAYPEDRISYILNDCSASIVLTHRGLLFKKYSGTCKVLDVDEFSIEDTSKEFQSPLLDDLVYIIYTSGSTGNPKGVMIEHIGLVDYLQWAARQYVRGVKLSFPLFTSLSFDLTITSLFLPIITGGTLVVYEDTDGPVDSSIVDVINDNSVDIIKLTPSHLSLLQQIDLSHSCIKRMILGGEDLKVHLTKKVHDQFPHEVEIYNEYGPTEAVVGCMIHRFDPHEDKGVSVPIGKPADSVQIYVLNDQLVPVVPGVPGELCISRTGLARGYVQLPKLTEKRFVQNPFKEDDRLYRTGDLVRFNDRGILEYLGRIDRQVKISGVRIEPGEIEQVMMEIDLVEACVVRPYATTRGIDKTGKLSYCTKCGLPSNYPKVSFDEDGICGICHSYESIKDVAQSYFKTMPELHSFFEGVRAQRSGEYDCLALLSGGKDSTYALCQLVDMGLKVRALTLDNGYISKEAKANVARVVDALDVGHEFVQTSAMNDIFKDSLARFSNVCNGCFKTIYTLAVNHAKSLNISVIVTGLSRGQFFETRLTENTFRAGRFTPEDVDQAVLEARKYYHQDDDAVRRSLDTSHFDTVEVFEAIRFLDFYRYCDVSMSDMMNYLRERVNWVRPKDTGRSTNCLVNDVGIYIHNKERGYHNYALPYSWDVRMGHKTREEAIDELNDELDMDDVQSMLNEIGYDENRLKNTTSRSRLVGYYVSSEQLDPTDIRRRLLKQLPDELIPSKFFQLDSIPLTSNGKVDFKAMPNPDAAIDSDDVNFVEPEGLVEEQIAEIWREVLAVDHLSSNKSFFQFGGTSLAAMEVMLKICNQFEIDLPLQTVFQRNSIVQLAIVVEAKLFEEISELTDEEAERLVAGHLEEKG